MNWTQHTLFQLLKRSLVKIMEPKQSASLADLHLVTHTWANRPQLHNDSILAMKHFFDYCLETCSSAKLLGDMFHTLTPRPEFVKPLFDKITEMQDAGLPVYYIQGNHDLNLVPWLSLHPWPINLNRVTVELPECGMTVLGQQSTNHDELMCVFGSIPEGVDTLLLHQAEVRALPFSPEFTLDDVPPQIKNVLIGHIHSPQDYSNTHTTLWYPGSPHVTGIDGIGPKGFLVEKVLNGETSISREVIPGRGFYKIVMTGAAPDELDEVEEMVREIAGDDARVDNLIPVIQVSYPPHLASLAHQRLLALRGPLDVYTWLSSDGAVEDDVSLGGRAETTVSDVNMSEIIGRYVDQPVPRELLLQIYGGNDTGDVLRSGLEEVL